MIQFSIIIPHKNIPRLLERCLASIPDREDLQVIIVDDNSDPGTVDFRHFPGKERRYTEVYETKEGKGAGYARNVGLLHAKGEWLLFADADDFFTKEFTSILKTYAHAECDLILFPRVSVDSDDTHKESDRAIEYNKIICNKALTEKEKAVLSQAPSSKLIKRKLVTQNHIRFEEIKCANDVMFSVQTAVKARNIHIDTTQPLYCITTRRNSLTMNRDLESFRCRLHTCIRCSRFLRQERQPQLMWQVNSYLYWAKSFGKTEVLRTAWTLWRNGLFRYVPSHSWHNGYYNTGGYILYKALS